MAPAACAAAGLLNRLGLPRDDSGLVPGFALGVLQALPDQVTSHHSMIDLSITFLNIVVKHKCAVN